MRNDLKKIYFGLALALLLSFQTYAQVKLYEGVCRKSYAAGFEDEANIGRALCGENTSHMHLTKIYLTTKDGYVYAHSNYITPGYNFEHPTKVASSKVMDLENIGINVFFAELPTQQQFAAMKRAMKNDVEIIVDPKLINDAEYGTHYFEDFSKISFVCPDGVARNSIRINDRSGGFEFGIKYNNQFSMRITEQNLNFLFSELRDTKIDFRNLGIINLVENRKTKEILATKFPGKGIDFDFSSVDTFKKILLANKGKRTVILGHIEDGDFVTLKSGVEIFKIPVSEVQSFQKENNLELIILGCNSANSGAGSGALNKFNSIDALNRLERAEKTNNVEEFLDSLSMGTIHFLVDQTFFRKQEAPIFKESNEIPERIAIYVYDKPGSKLRNVNYNSNKGFLMFLGLGTAEYTAIEMIGSAADTSANKTESTTQVAPVNNRPNDNTSNDSGSDGSLRLKTIAALLILMLGVVMYILKSKDK